MGTLFVAGCDRSGTTAFADYLNKHRQVMILRERYRLVPEEITPDKFSFESILDWSDDDRVIQDEIRRKRRGEQYRESMANLVSSKESTELKWIGDKDPGYIEYLETLAENNPEARFVIMYRPVEEVAESWEARAGNPRDLWPSHRDFEAGVQTWNRAQRRTREFLERELNPKALIVSYHDFFYRNDLCSSLVSRFLDLEIDATVRGIWEEMSTEFELARRPKGKLEERQQEFIRENKDRAAEEWILKRIAEQWSRFGLDSEEKASRARHSDRRDLAAALMEARGEAGERALKVRRLRERVEQLENSLFEKNRKMRDLEQRNLRLERRAQSLDRQLRSIKESRTWKFLNKLGSVKARVLGR